MQNSNSTDKITTSRPAFVKQVLPAAPVVGDIILTSISLLGRGIYEVDFVGEGEKGRVGLKVLLLFGSRKHRGHVTCAAEKNRYIGETVLRRCR